MPYLSQFRSAVAKENAGEIKFDAPSARANSLQLFPEFPADSTSPDPTVQTNTRDWAVEILPKLQTVFSQADFSSAAMLQTASKSNGSG